jgi:hypothetical protein
MSKTATLQNKNLILTAVFGFGGMLTAIIASIAVVTPLVNAQVNSALAFQTARQTAQVSSIQTQPVASVTPAASCTAPAVESKKATVAPAHHAQAVTGGKGAAMNHSAFKASWMGKPAVAYGSVANSGNTTINNTTNTTHTTNKTKVDISVKDSFNTDSQNVTIKDSGNNNGNTIKDNTVIVDSFKDNTIKNNGNTTTTNNDNDLIIKDNTVIVDSFKDNKVTIKDNGNTTNTDINVSDNTVIANNTVTDNGNTTDSFNEILSNNEVLITPTI